MKTWQCIVCGFIYDEAKGLPEDGIAPGTVWADVPANWECPQQNETPGAFMPRGSCEHEGAGGDSWEDPWWEQDDPRMNAAEGDGEYGINQVR